MIRWSWKHKYGTIKLEQHNKKFDLIIYAGTNCLAVIVYEWNEKDKETGKTKRMYDVVDWWNDYKSVRVVTGLAKDCEGNKYDRTSNEGNFYKKLKLNAFYDESLRISTIFAKAKHKVELYYEAPKEVK